MFVGDRERFCVASESCRFFLETSHALLRTKQCGRAEKSGLRDVQRADFVRYRRRSGLKNPDKAKIFIKKNVRNHSYHQFHPVLAKIRINRDLLHFQLSIFRRPKRDLESAYSLYETWNGL